MYQCIKALIQWQDAGVSRKVVPELVEGWSLSLSSFETLAQALAPQEPVVPGAVPEWLGFGPVQAGR